MYIIYMYVCMYYTDGANCIYILAQSVYNVICMYVFKADYLVSDIQLVCPP